MLVKQFSRAFYIFLFNNIIISRARSRIVQNAKGKADVMHRLRDDAMHRCAAILSLPQRGRCRTNVRRMRREIEENVSAKCGIAGEQ